MGNKNHLLGLSLTVRGSGVPWSWEEALRPSGEATYLHTMRLLHPTRPALEHYVTRSRSLRPIRKPLVTVSKIPDKIVVTWPYRFAHHSKMRLYSPVVRSVQMMALPLCLGRGCSRLFSGSMSRVPAPIRGKETCGTAPRRARHSR